MRPRGYEPFGRTRRFDQKQEIPSIDVTEFEDRQSFNRVWRRYRNGLSHGQDVAYRRAVTELKEWLSLLEEEKLQIQSTQEATALAEKIARYPQSGITDVHTYNKLIELLMVPAEHIKLATKSRYDYKRFKESMTLAHQLRNNSLCGDVYFLDDNKVEYSLWQPKNLPYEGFELDIKPAKKTVPVQTLEEKLAIQQQPWITAARQTISNFEYGNTPLDDYYHDLVHQAKQIQGRPDQQEDFEEIVKEFGYALSDFVSTQLLPYYSRRIDGLVNAVRAIEDPQTKVKGGNDHLLRVMANNGKHNLQRLRRYIAPTDISTLNNMLYTLNSLDRCARHPYELVHSKKTSPAPAPTVPEPRTRKERKRLRKKR